MSTDAAAFLALFPGSHTFQTFGEGKMRENPRLTQVVHGSFSQQQVRLSVLNELGAGVYFSVNATDGTGRRAENVETLRAIVCEFDHGVPEMPGLPPSVRVASSPGREQWYWLLDAPLPATMENVAAWKAVEAGVVGALGGDPAAKLVTQVLRVPGFINNKRAEPFTVAWLEPAATPRRYRLEELAAAFPAPKEAEEKAPPVSLKILTGDNALPPEEQRKKRYAAWLDAQEVPSAGAGARNRWYYVRVAAALRDFAIEDEEWLLDTLAAHSAAHHGAAAYEYDDFRKLLRNASRSATASVGAKVLTPSFIPTVSAGPVAAAAQVVPMIEQQVKKTKKRSEAGEDKLATVNALADDAALAFVERYKVLRSEDGVLTLLEVAERGVVRTVSKEALVTALTQRYGKLLLPTAIRHELLPAVASRFALHALRAEQIRPFRFASDEAGDWAWARLPFDPDPTAKCPEEFASILGRCESEAQARSLVLWIGSLLDYTSSRKQYVHLSGVGNDGKSTLTNMLVRVFGHRSCTEMRAEDFKDSHATTALEGARLVIFHDENNAAFMSSGRFKAMTGDEYWTINPKGQARRGIVLNCKVIVSSNERPEIRGSSADMDRILPVYLKRYEGGQDPGFVQRLNDARYRVMQYCYGEWERHRAAGGLTVPIAEDAREEVEAYASSATAEQLLEQFFVADPKAATITPADAQKVLRNNASPPALATQAYALLRARSKVARVSRTGPRVIVGYRFRDIA